MLALGFVAEKPFFQVPTATSAFFFLSIIIALVGVFIYWAGGWGTTAIFVAVIAINYFSKYDMFGYQNRASGLNYETKPREYSVNEFRKLSSPDNIKHDLQYFRAILNNWQKKNKTTGRHKPKMVFVNVSGGGLRAGVFATAILQRADSLLGGNLFPQTFLMTGASGGMFGLTLLREQLIRQADNFPVNIYDQQLPMDIGKDLLNPMFVNAMSNDMLLPFHKTKIGKYETFRDRAVMLEKQLEINNPGCFNKTIGDYKQVEFNARVPLVMWHLAVVNDSRKLFVSPHPVSFLMRPVGRYTTNKQMVIDGIDYGQYFAEQDGYSTTVASVNRMNATFPWILPNAVLPTEPATMIMDGGALDNFGSEITLRFINSFKEWIAQNTSGVVILQIRDTEKDKEIEPMKLKTAVSKFSDPVGMFYNNLENIQDFAQSQSFGFLNEALKGNMQIIYFEYISEDKEQKAAMSLHLTEKAKQDIRQSVERKNNQAAFELLRQAMQ